MMEKPFTTLSSKIAWSCPWYNIRQDEFLMPGGQTGIYNIVQKAPSVWIVPVTAQGDIVLLRQYRYTVDDWCWEVPAGSVKEGQTPLQAAHEELREEIGGHSTQWTDVGPFYTANGICNEVGRVYIAENVELRQPAHEAAEVIEIYHKPVSLVLQMAQENRINDGSSALALLLSRQHLARYG